MRTNHGNLAVGVRLCLLGDESTARAVVRITIVSLLNQYVRPCRIKSSDAFTQIASSKAVVLLAIICRCTFLTLGAIAGSLSKALVLPKIKTG